MTGVRIVTDSACDLTDDEVADLGIVVVPLTIRFGAEELVDRQEITVDQFYARMATASELPQTAAPAPGAFETAFRQLFDEGADAVVCINLSAALSATMQSAQTAANALPDRRIEVIDSRTITAGLGVLVTRAATAAAAGATVDEVVAQVEALRPRVRVYGTLDTLENLKKGGRIGGAQALLGTMLSIKPLLDLSSGEVAEAGKQRTRKKALAWLRDRVLEAGDIEELCVMHGGADDADELVEMLAPHVDRASIRVGPIGAVIGTHGGPGVIGVTFLTA